MKKILPYILAVALFIAIPQGITFALTTVPWVTQSITAPNIYPNLVNGNKSVVSIGTTTSSGDQLTVDGQGGDAALFYATDTFGFTDQCEVGAGDGDAYGIDCTGTVKGGQFSDQTGANTADIADELDSTGGQFRGSNIGVAGTSGSFVGYLGLQSSQAGVFGLATGGSGIEVQQLGSGYGVQSLGGNNYFSGFVGVATSTPWKTLSVAGDEVLTGALYDNTASPGLNGYVLESTGSGIKWVSSGAGANFFTNSGANTYLNTGLNLEAPYFTGTSTTATSTFGANVLIGKIGTDSLTNKTPYALRISTDSSYPFIPSGNASIDLDAASNDFAGNWYIEGDEFGMKYAELGNVSTSGQSPDGGSYIGTLSGYTLLGSIGGNGLQFGEGAKVIETISNSGFVGISTTSPWRNLSVMGSSDLGNNALAGSFTATSTTATSTFSDGINLTGGCFSIGNVCVGNGSGSGSVTSVAMTVPTGLTVAGSPITTSGTLAVSLTAGYNIPLTASTTQWNNFYNSSTTLPYVTSVAATVPTGLTVSGSPITTSGTLAFGLQAGYNIPLTASTTQWNNLVNASTTLPYVTSVSGSGGSTGLTLTGGPITSSGTLTLGGTLAVANGGTGATSFGQGWVGINNAGAFISSTSPTVNYITSTSTTYANTFADDLNLTGATPTITGTSFLNLQASGSDNVVQIGNGQGAALKILNYDQGWADNSQPNGFFEIALSQGFFTGNSGQPMTRFGIATNGMTISDVVYNSLPAPTALLLLQPKTSTSQNILNIQGIAAQTGDYLNVTSSGGASGNILRVNSSGNVGIGTTSPWETLSVKGSSDLGKNALAGSFTATSTSATSTFAAAITVGAGQGTSTFAGGISATVENITSTTATSTHGNGINLTNGCFSIAGVCLSTSGGGTNYLTLSGANTYLNTGTNLQAPTLNATSTTATSTFSGGITLADGNVASHQATWTVGTNYRTADYTSIQSAYNIASTTGGGTIHIQSGSYTLTSALKIGGAPVIISGDGYSNSGAGGTLIEFNGSTIATSTLFSCRNTSCINNNLNDGVTIENLEIDDTSQSGTASGSGTCIDMSYGDDITIINVKCYGEQNGFWAQNTVYVSLTNIEMDPFQAASGKTGYGVYLGGSPTNSAEGNAVNIYGVNKVINQSGSLASRTEGWYIDGQNIGGGGIMDAEGDLNVGIDVGADAYAVNINAWSEGNATGIRLASGSHNINLVGMNIANTTADLTDNGAIGLFNHETEETAPNNGIYVARNYTNGANFGISTTTPATALDVNGDITDEKLAPYTGTGTNIPILCGLPGGKIGHIAISNLVGVSPVCSAN